MAAMAIMQTLVPSMKGVQVTTLRNRSSTSTFGATKLGKLRGKDCVRVQALWDVRNDPIVKDALKEPVAFLGGVFAGLLRLDLNEEPLKEWIAKTAEAAGIVTDEPEPTSSDKGPNEIEIE